MKFIKYKSQLKDIIKEISSNREIEFIIFGASKYGQMFLQYAKELRIDIKCFCDNDITKWGTDIDGINIYSPSILKKNDKQVIFIASSYFREIYKQLEDIDVGNIYYCDMLREDRINEIKEKDYKNSTVITGMRTNKFILDIINRNKPAMITRLGNVELGITLASLKNEIINETLRKEAINNAGIFPNDNSGLNEFSNIFINSLKDVDCIGVSFYNDEKYVIDKFCRNNIKFAFIESLMQIGMEDSWTQSLKNKRVLVIHPFEESIIKQYHIRGKLFKNENMLPEFDLKTLKAVQSLGGSDEFRSWSEALEFMERKIENIEFDIALIGAGAYGLPLASFIKRRGKIAIHIGGALQLLFGIMGNRWKEEYDREYDIFKYINEKYWIRPSINERPQVYKQVEMGCYW